MLKKRLYNQNEDDGLEELEDDPELKELGDEDSDLDELGETEKPGKADEDESGALDEEK